jgi:hypothetical protein
MSLRGCSPKQSGVAPLARTLSFREINRSHIIYKSEPPHSGEAVGLRWKGGVWFSHYRLTNPDYVMLSGAKHLYHGIRDPSVAEKRSLRVT